MESKLELDRHCTFSNSNGSSFTQIDLEALTLLNEANLMEMKVEIGPRKKIMKAIEERRKAMAEGDADDGDRPLEDSRL